MKLFLKSVFIFLTVVSAQHQSILDSTIINEKIQKSKIDGNNIMKNDSVIINTASEIFEYQMTESKLILSEAIISDATGDTLDAKYQFEMLFESLATLDQIDEADEFQKLELNRLMQAGIDYYENKAITIDKIDLAKAKTAQIDWTTEKGREIVENNWFSLDLN